MNTNNKTLADVQPGGRVRLVDQGRRCAEHCQNGRADVCLASQRDGVICPDDSCDIDDGIRHNHLSAQPSPGAQAAHCPVKHCGMTYARVPADGRCHACGASVQPSTGGQGYSNGRIDIGSDVVIGGRKAKVIGLDPYTPCLEIEWADAQGGKEYRPREQMILATRQPVGEEPVTVEAVATVRRNSDGDRYIDWLTEGGIADLEAGDVLMVSDRAITDEDGSGEVYTAPPAQAVDLGQFRDLAQRWADKADLAPSPMTARSCSQQLLALIDSKAVGK